jgi:hypothetical protein
MNWIVSHFHAQQWRPLLVQNVPGIQTPIHPGGKKDRGSGGTPAPIRQVFCVGTCPHDRRLFDVLGPDPGTPVSNGEKVLWEAGIPLEGIDRAKMGVVHGRDSLIGGLGLFIA